MTGQQTGFFLISFSRLTYFHFPINFYIIVPQKYLGLNLSMEWKNLIQTKPLVSEHAAVHPELQRCLSAFDLTLLGIGAIIGAGIFVLTGVAAATKAGPAIIFSFLLAGLTSTFSALSYAELAASIGGCGSAYGYAYASFGEFIAWIIGWDLLLEYGMSCSTVAIGWAGYANNALHAININLPQILLKNPAQGGIVNLPAYFVHYFFIMHRRETQRAL